MISLIYDTIAWEEKEIIKAMQKENINYNIINAKDKILNLTGPTGIEGTVLLRCMSHKRSLYYSYVLEANGIATVNSYNTFNTAGNKLLTTAYLYRNGIPTPETTASFSKDSAIKSCQEAGYPVVFKPVTGSWGRMISLIGNDNMAETVFSMNDMINENVYYIQKYVKRPPRDIRAIIVNGKISAVIYRYAGEGWKTNLYLGGKVEKAELDKEQEEIILKTAELFAPGIIGIDAMETENGLVVHEVNSRVEFKGASRAYGGKIIEDIAAFLKSID
ncbi:MAG: RimK family alpha-L-glutamate ligase [Ferroplasma sp.]